MTELILLSVIVALCVLIGYERKTNKDERMKFLNALIAKNAQELSQLDAVDKLKVEVSPQKEPDLKPLSDMTDEEFEKEIIEKQAV